MSLTADWKEWRDIAKVNGISSNTFRMRKKRGMEPEEAATKPLQHVETEQRGGLTAADYRRAEENGISRQTAHYRYEILFWDKETAITKELTGKSIWSEWKDIAYENGVSYHTFLKRRAKGMSLEAAATTEPRRGKRHG